MTRYQALPWPSPTTAPLVADASDWARLALDAAPQLRDMLGMPIPDRAAIDARLTALRDEARADGLDDIASLDRAMRRLRREVLLVVMDADLAGRASLDDVCGAMTDLAQACLETCCAAHYAALAARHGTPGADGAPQPFVVVGMGKLGGRELNVSSDIDLIFVFPEAGETDGAPPIENHDFFVRLARSVIGSLARVDEHGWVFRVDMRLRPNGDAGPLVSSLAALETYFVVQGREWERYAWIKARVVAIAGGDATTRAEAIRDLESLRRPFVFRKYLDFGAIAAIRALHAQIRSEAARRAATHPSRATDVKLGRGGIREIEFVAQVFQLIRGGRVRALQVRPTCEALLRLAEHGLLGSETARALIADYGFLRALEHRLQYVDDAQTHSVPPDGPARERVARMMGYASATTLMQALAEVQQRVERAFDAVVDDSQREARTPCPWLSDALREAEGVEAARDAIERCGIVPGTAVAQRYAALVRGRRWQSLPDASRVRLAALVEPSLAVAARSVAPEAAALRFVDLFEAVAQRSAYLALLHEFPNALTRVGAILAASPWAADYLARHPLLLDELLDARDAPASTDWPAVRRDLDASMDDAVLPSGGPDVERRMDLLREVHHVHTFALLARDLAGHLTVEALADELSALADLVIDATIAQCWQTLASRHRDAPRFAVIAYGKLGGKELGYASDLDLVFVYDDDDERAPEAYAKLAQRVVTWLTAHTSAGRLFDVDMRLRPNGNAGLLVTSLDAFEKYQLHRGSNAAWGWEHQALTRARHSAGDAQVGARFERIRRTVLALPRDPSTLLAEIAAMRERIHAGHPNPTPQFDLKHDTGGMIDIEFIVQALVLLHASQWPEMIDNKGNIALLGRATDRGALSHALAHACADAYRTYRARQHAIRLQAEGEPGPTRVAPELFVAERAAVTRAWAAVFDPTPRHEA